MPIFQTGWAPEAMRYIDPSGAEHHVVAAYLGDRLVWDGTVPASLTAPRMNGYGSVPEPEVCAAATVTVPIMEGAGEIPEPVPGGGGGVVAPIMAGLSALLEPEVGGSATVYPDAMEGTGEMHEPGVGTEVPGSVLVPTATGSGSVPVPTVHVPATVAAPVMEGSGELQEVQIEAGGTIAVPAATGEGVVPEPSVVAGAAVQSPAMTGAGGMPTPTHAAGHSLEVPSMTGSGEMPVPAVEALNFPPSGMNKSGNYTCAAANVWYTLPSWVVRSGYPDTTIVTNGIEVPAGAEVTISGQLTWGATDAFSGGTMKMRVVANGTMIGAQASTAAYGSTAVLIPFTWKNETGAPALVQVQASTASTAFSRGIVNGGVNSYLTVTAVIPLVLRAADDFNRPNGELGSNWVTTGGGTLNIVNQKMNGAGTPHIPVSYAWWHEPMPSDTQVVRATIHWEGNNPEHSACVLMVRANPFGSPPVPETKTGVHFSWTGGIMALFYYNASGYVPLPGTDIYTSTSKFPEGAVCELHAEGNVYKAKVNGVVVMQGTLDNSVIPFSNRYVGAAIQDDSSQSGGGDPPGRLDNFQVFTP